MTPWILVVVASCGHKHSTEVVPSSSPGPCQVEAAGAPGVRIKLSSATCRYRVGEAATFHYELAIADDLQVDVPASGGCACTGYSEDPTSFVRYTIEGTSAAGHRQMYCEDCDTGCCPGTDATTILLKHGTRSAQIAWPGRIWSGPSDTSNPLGPVFEPGTYEVKVRFSAFDRGQVVAVLPIEIAP